MINLHTHTTYSDGRDTIEEMVLAAIGKGLNAIGVSDHSAAPQNLYPGVNHNTFTAYLTDIRAAAKKYGAQIEVYAGLENEYCYPMPAEGLDYVIGSVHYMPHEGGYLCADASPGEFEHLAAVMCGGDYIKLARRYFDMIADMARSQKPDIIGHFDIITKFNRTGAYFDTSSPAYMDAVRTALEAAAESGCIIEVNTGGMSRGYTVQPYPERHILIEILKMGIPVILSSDAHLSEDLDYAFAETAKYLEGIGFKSTRQLANGRFTDAGLT